MEQTLDEISKTNGTKKVVTIKLMDGGMSREREISQDKASSRYDKGKDPGFISWGHLTEPLTTKPQKGLDSQRRDEGTISLTKSPTARICLQA